MRILYPNYNAVPYYQRGATQKVLAYHGDGVIPHALIQRATYTVPTFKAAKVTGLTLTITRSTASVAGGSVQAYIEVTTSSIAYIIYNVRLYGLTVGLSSRCDVGEALWLNAGDLIRIMTEDLCADGAIDFNCAIMAVEFTK